MSRRILPKADTHPLTSSGTRAGLLQSLRFASSLAYAPARAWHCQLWQLPKALARHRERRGRAAIQLRRWIASLRSQ
jgi:hypothetical protein